MLVKFTGVFCGEDLYIETDKIHAVTPRRIVVINQDPYKQTQEIQGTLIFTGPGGDDSFAVAQDIATVVAWIPESD